MIRARFGQAVVVLALAVCAGAGCGYALAGRGNTLPSHIRIVGIPQFENGTVYPELDRIVTESVRAEFSSRGRFRVLPEVEGADAVMTGRITRIDLVPSNLSSTLQASRYTVTLVVSVEFRDKTNNDEMIWSNPSMVFRDEYDVPPEASQADPTAFFRQDVNALERLSKNFARTAVTSILEAF
jgi:hypothetical protein